jgi:hypothetical protein
MSGARETSIRCGPGLPWSFFTLSPWMPTLASTGDGATVSIHTTMAQPLLFSNSGRNVEPIRRRMARRGMRVASEAYTVPMQQPMPRLNKELGHKVVDKVWIWMFMWMRV